VLGDIMGNIERIKKDYDEMKVVGKELISSYQQGYIGKTTSKVTLANGKEVIVDMKDKVSDKILLQVTTRPKWIIDTEIPMFKGEDRKYIDKLIYLKEEK
jgi:hypothetical protein